jgi:hypothetical protein
VTDAPDIAALARLGVAVIVGTRDAELRPAVARAWGPVLSAEGTRLALCVEAPEASPTQANLLAGSPVAVTLSLPTTYSTVQLKGPVASVAPPDEEDLALVRAHREAFTAEVGALGVPAPVISRTFGDELLLVAVDVAERYDGTPGPGAGRAL